MSTDESIAASASTDQEGVTVHDGRPEGACDDPEKVNNSDPPELVDEFQGEADDQLEDEVGKDVPNAGRKEERKMNHHIWIYHLNR